MKSENRQILLTPAGAGAIAVIRLIGPGVGDFLREHFSHGRDRSPSGSVHGVGRDRSPSGPVHGVGRDRSPSGPVHGGNGGFGETALPFTSLRCIHGDLRDGEKVIDDVVVVLGEGLADINTHGGPWVVHCVVELAGRAGFVTSSDPLDGVDGQTMIEKEIAAALPLAKTELAIDVLLAQREAWLHIRPEDGPRMLGDESLVHLLYPPRVAIIGVPNVGKSTLANQLFAQERSITADLPGTTRDWVGELANIDGLPVVLVDTPGLRQSEDPIEQQAIQRSRPVIAAADLVVLVFDPTQDRAAQDRLAAAYPAGLRVLNKTDRPAMWKWENAASRPICIVATTGEGVDELRRAIQRHFQCDGCDPDLARCWTERQRAEIHRRIGGG